MAALQRETRIVACDVFVGDDIDPWGRAVDLLLGPVIGDDGRERRRADALALAEAATRAAQWMAG